MTFFFNLTNLETISGGDPKKFLKILELFYYKKLYVNREKLIGSSFLLNPEPLFKNKNVDILYKIQYIKLAAKRDYFLYKEYDIKSLQLSYFPDILLNTIKINPLITITNTEIFFYYEEVTARKQKWH